jgi:tetratricopeptide (TPR) repeat protein
MDTGCSRSLYVFDRPPREITSNNNQANQRSRVLARPACSVVLAVLGIIALVLPSLLIAQSEPGQKQVAQNLTPQNYTISTGQLKIPDRAWSYLQSANKQFRKNNLPGAEQEIGRALRADPACAPAFSMLAFIKLAAKNPAGAVEDAEHAISIDPYEVEPFIALAMSYNSLKDFPNATSAAEHALRIRPDSWQGLLELAESLYGEGHLRAALEQLNAIQTDFSDVHLVRGNVLMGLGRRPEALDEFGIFLKEEPVDSRDEQIRQIIAAPFTSISQRLPD